MYMRVFSDSLALGNVDLLVAKDILLAPLVLRAYYKMLHNIADGTLLGNKLINSKFGDCYYDLNQKTVRILLIY